MVCGISGGAKDPFPRPLDIVRSSATTVDNKELTVNATTSAEVGTVSYTISNPDIRIFSANDWHNEWRNNGLWGNSDGLTKNVKLCMILVRKAIVCPIRIAIRDSLLLQKRNVITITGICL